MYEKNNETEAVFYQDTKWIQDEILIFLKIGILNVKGTISIFLLVEVPLKFLEMNFQFEKQKKSHGAKFGLVSLFNNISLFVGYSMPNQSF